MILLPRLIYYTLFILSLSLQFSIQQPVQSVATAAPTNVECIHPTNYSDFTILLLNNTVVVTGGGSANELQVWTQDLSNGFDIHKNCWTENSDILASSSSGAVTDNRTTTTTTNTTTPASTAAGGEDFQPYRNGVGFQYSNTSFAVQAGDNGTTTMSTMALFDLTTNLWSKPPVQLQGQQPIAKARMSVSLNTTTNVAWLYGGRTVMTQQPADYYNTFYSFDINANTWNWPTTLYSGGYRPARYGHSSNLVNERLFILGGKTAVHSSTDNSWVVSSGDFQSVLVYDTVTHQGISMATIGDIPPARFSYSAVNAPDGRSIVIFGGQNASSESTFDASNDIYVLDTCTLNWSQPIISGTPPIARAGHEAFTYLNQYMIVMMGIQNFSSSNNGPVFIDDSAILDMTTWTWIDHIPPLQYNRHLATPSPADCQFVFPVVLPDNDGGNGNNNDPGLNSTTISNTSNSATTKQLAFGITFGILGFLIFGTAFVIFILRIRRDVDAKQNPRWIPAVLKRKRSAAATAEENKHYSLNTTSTLSTIEE